MRLNRLLLFLFISMMGIVSVHAQTRTVTGKVLSAKDSSVVPNASVMYGTKGVATDDQGNFTLTLPNDASTIQVAALNYLTQTVPVTNNMVIYIKPFDQNLDAVVVIGYGTSRKKDLTGSVTTISAKEFNGGMVSSPEQLIQGKAAGVQITTNNGAPGAGVTIRIRGGASLNSSNDPLIVVDGVPLSMGTIGNVANPLAMINPSDIETFTILKDANATAIYGSRASNGVILITTKKGKSGKPVFTFTTTNSLSKAAKLVDVLSAAQIRSFVNEYGTDKQIALLGTANTDWQKRIFRTAFATDNNLSVVGTLNKWLPYRASVGFSDQSGILKRDNMKRVSAFLSLSPKFFDNHLKVDLNLRGSSTRSFFANTDAIGAAIQYDPTQSVYNAGSVFGGYREWLTNDTTPNPNAPRNPVALLNQKSNIGYADRSIGNLQMDYSFHFLPDLHANANVGYDVAKSHGSIFIPANAAQATDATPSQRGQSSHSKNTYYNYVVEGYLSYNKTISSIKSNINAVAGYGYYANNTKAYNDTTYAADGVTVKSSPSLPIDLQQNRLLSYYGRFIYTYDDRYILSATIRRDGSSKFSPSNRWGVFPSLGLTWRAINEAFLKNQNVLSDFKVRLSYGETGQQDGISNYSYQPTYYAGNSAGQYQIGDQYYTYYSPNTYDANLKWESTKTSNAGIDFGFLNNRITGSVDYYIKRTKNLLATVPISVGTNFSNTITTNVGDMNNNGLELNLNGIIIKTKDLVWNVGYNLSFYNTKIKNLSLNPDPTYMVSVGGITGSTGNYIQRHAINQTPYSFYVYKQVYGSDGKPLEGVYADLNGDGAITASDMYFYHSPAPKSTMGFNTSVSYLKWIFSTSLRASIGNYMYNNVASNFSTVYNVLSPSGLINNATTDIYKTHFSTPQYFSDYYIQNASFLRMDNLTVGYNFGSISDAHPDVQLSLTGTVQNVFIITKYKGLDPESPSNNGIDNNFYPRPRTYALTLGLKF